MTSTAANAQADSRAQVQTEIDEAYRKYQGLVLRAVSRFERDEAVARELAADAWTRALARWDTFRGAAERSTWLYKIATNVAKNHIASAVARKKRFRYEHEMAPLETDEGEQLASRAELVADERSPEPAALIEMRRAVKQLEAHMQEMRRTMPKSYKALAALAEGLDYEDIKRQLGVDDDTARCQVFRGRRFLRERMGESLAAALELRGRRPAQARRARASAAA